MAHECSFNKTNVRFYYAIITFLIQVAKVYSKDSVAEYKKIDVLNVWRG